jgi:microsomal dipeptidase-like Zn-dependent dipeptidase
MMAQKTFIADIHIHPTLKALNSGYPKPRKTIWDDIEPVEPIGNFGKLMKSQSNGIARYSQSNLYELAKGNVRLAGISLTPAEKGFLNGRQIGKLFLNTDTKVEMNQVINGFSEDSLRFLMTNNDYFQELQMDYRYLYDGQGASPDGQYRYKLVNNYGELEKTLAEDDHTLAVVLFVEGAHTLLNEKLLSGKLTPSEAKREITENIGIMKSWEVPPLSMGLCHHFYNDLCGHSRTIPGLANALFNQMKGLETGLTGLGIKTMKELLSRSNGKRVIIDTKHMSVKGRKEYYNWVRSYNYISEYDKIPVICSHTGVSGYKTMASGARRTDNAAKENSRYFCGLNINISDEEIKIIHETTGLIGIMLDKHRLGGGVFFKQHIQGVQDAGKIKQAYLRIFMDNILHIVKVLGKPGWDIVCLGSDYDGMIKNIDPYDRCSTMPAFAADLQQFLEQQQYERAMWYGYTPEELIRKIMSTNAMAFFERHFV